MKKLAEKIIDQLEILLEMEISAYILNDAKQLAFIKLLYKRRTDILKKMFNLSRLKKEEYDFFRSEVEAEIIYGELLRKRKN